MTEYTTSSQAIREYMSSRERTAHWVHSHSPSEVYSPSVPPSVLDDDAFGSPPSDVESSHSVPPRMVLRYGDGRPDVPILPAEPVRSRSRRHEDSSSPSPISPPPKNRQRSGSHGSSPLSQSHHTNSRSSERSPPSPEEIRILPSHAKGPQPSSSSHPTRTRSRSLPRPADLHSHVEGFVPPPVAPPVPQIPLHAPGPAPQPSAWHPYQHGGRHQKQPPAIVYAPSHHRTRYTPPPIYHYPPQMGPNGMIYSHSAPVNQNQYRHNNNATAPYPQNMMHPSQVREDAFAGGRRDNFMDRDRAISLSARGIPPPIHVDPSSSSSSVSSDESGGTYYILPHQGQKVHIITPSPERSVDTATSTTRTQNSPHPSTSKKPFLQRLFSFAKLSSIASSKASSIRGRRLQRRHSAGPGVTGAEQER